MTTVQELTKCKITVDEQQTGTQRLWLDNIVIAAPSWHVDFDGLITVPPNDDYREDWLVDCCGGNYPDFSKPAGNIITDVLSDHNDELIEFFESDPVDRTDLLARMQSEIRQAALAYIIKRQPKEQHATMEAI